jgi:hypothetical protein
MNSKAVRALVALFSAGWLIPLWVSVRTYLDFMQFEIRPAVLGHPEMNSFPFLNTSKNTFTIACVWLGMVILFWSHRALSPRTSNGPA